jgi:hypothetical protein
MGRTLQEEYAEYRALVENAGVAAESLVRYKVSWLWGMMTRVGRKSARIG